jgi:hypothetical protein
MVKVVEKVNGDKYFNMERVYKFFKHLLLEVIQ